MAYYFFNIYIYIESLSSKIGKNGKSCCYWGLCCKLLWRYCGEQESCGWGLTVCWHSIFHRQQSPLGLSAMGFCKEFSERILAFEMRRKIVKCKLRKWWVRMIWMVNSYSSADIQIVWKVSFVARDSIKSFLFSLFICSFSWNSLSFPSLYCKNRHISDFDCEKLVSDTSFCG